MRQKLAKVIDFNLRELELQSLVVEDEVGGGVYFYIKNNEGEWLAVDPSVMEESLSEYMIRRMVAGDAVVRDVLISDLELFQEVASDVCSLSEYMKVKGVIDFVLGKSVEKMITGGDQ